MDVKILVHKNSHAEGIVPRKTCPIDAAGNIMLSYSGEGGFTVEEVSAAVELFFMCPTCGSSIKVEAEYKSSTPPVRKLYSIGDVERYLVRFVERAEGFIYYKWMCRDDKSEECIVASGWRAATAPELKPVSGRDAIK